MTTPQLPGLLVAGPVVTFFSHERIVLRHLRLVPVGSDGHRLASKPGMDEIEREAIRAEGLDPDDPAVVTAIDLVRRQLSLYFGDQHTRDEPAQYRG